MCRVNPPKQVARYLTIAEAIKRLSSANGGIKKRHPLKVGTALEHASSFRCGCGAAAIAHHARRHILVWVGRTFAGCGVNDILTGTWWHERPRDRLASPPEFAVGDNVDAKRYRIRVHLTQGQ